MKNFLMWLCTYFLSFIIFYFLFQKIKVEQFLSKKNIKPLLVLGINFVLLLVLVLVFDNIPLIGKYHFYYMGILLGELAAIMPFLLNKDSKKS